jgi:hypothetical protein
VHEWKSSPMLKAETGRCLSSAPDASV